MDWTETRDFNGIVDVEKIVIAAVLKSERSRDNVLQKLQTKNFYDPKAQVAFETALFLYISGITIDKNTVLSEIKRKEHKAFIEDCFTITFAESSIDHLCNKIREESQIRDINSLAQDIALQIDDPKSSYEEIVDNLHEKVTQVITDHDDKKIVTPADLFDKVFEEIKNRKPGERPKGVKSSLESVDNIIGILPKKDVILMAGRPGHGKTQLGVQTCMEAARSGIPTLFLSLEMSEEELLKRMMANMAEVNLSKIRLERPDDKEMERLSKSRALLELMPFYFQSISSLSVAEVKAKARQVDIMTKGNLGLIAVDYIQLMGDSTNTTANRNDVVGALSRGLKEVAMSMDIPVLALCQLNREIERRENKKPLLSDLRDSGTLEQDASIIMFLYREFLYNNKEEDRNKLEVHIAKHRNGPLGTVRVYNQPQFMKITDNEGENW